MKHILIALIKFYRYFLSPYIGSSCRFHPTCSVYALEAIEKYGAAKGSWLGIKRLLRCHPFSPGGYDPVPGTEQSDISCNHSHENKEKI